MSLESSDRKQRSIAFQIQAATRIDAPAGYEAIIKSSKFSPDSKVVYYGFHFEKAGTYKIGDTIDNGGGIVSTVEDIV